MVYTDTYRSYDVLNVSEFSHFRINHRIHFAENHNHINIWGIKQNAIYTSLTTFPNVHFDLYLKECEWRFNYSNIESKIFILKQNVKYASL